MRKTSASYEGFTLIELSIVLVIIGLIVGGVLVGQDLIRAAAARAQVSQIEKYNTAVNTFRDKYGALPGDLNAAIATQFGFAARGNGPGQGDGNGVLEAYAANVCGFCENYGETAMFWVDLSKASLIDGSFGTASATVAPVSNVTGSGIDLYYPAAKIGGGNYVYVWSGGPTLSFTSTEINNNGINYFGLSAITKLSGGDWRMYSNPGLTVAQAYSIDKKVDDGLPQSGSVFAM
jgi:prepilin-type N-terminal cleavage/methylation domain-containing protein